MASGSGSWSPTTGSGNRGRLVWQIDQSPSSVGSGTGSVSLRLRVWYESRYSIVDSSNTYTVSGAWSGSGSASVNHGGSGGSTLLYDGTITVSTSYAGTVSRSFSASFTGINATPNIPSVSGSHTVARRPVQEPNAPTNVGATYVSDSRADIAWSLSTSTARPVTSVRVQRRVWGLDGQWGSWATVATLSGAATSWSDRGIRDNRSFQWRIQARNASGSTLSGSTDSLRTTPRPPVNVAAVKLADGDIRVSYDRVAPPWDPIQHVVQDNPGGTGWVTVATQSGSGPIVVTDPNPAVTHRYRVATVDPRSGRQSAWSVPSNIVQLQAAPDAPTLLSPSGTVDQDVPTTFEWRHNSVDTTEQVAYQLRYRVNGGGWVTLTGTTALSRTVSALNVSGTVEWQVRTRGSHPDWSPWSAIASFQVGAAPSVAINTPAAGTLAQSRVDLEIGYYQPDGSLQNRVEARLVVDGVVVETLSWSGTSTARSFTTALDDATDYVVHARVRAANGLWSEWDEVAFTTDFPQPLPIALHGEWDRDTGAVNVTGEIMGGLVDYAWTGTPNESASTRTDDAGTVTNLFTNPDMVATSGEVVVWDSLAAPEWRSDPDLTEVENADGTFTYFGTQVAGLTATNGVVVQSTQWSKSGGVSARFINNAGDDLVSYAAVSGMGDAETVVLHRYQDKAFPVPSAYSQYTGGAYFPGSPANISPLVPNEPGEHLIRFGREEGNTSPYLRLWGAWKLGESVWFDLLTATDAPNYDGPPFSGSTRSTVPAETMSIQRRDTPDSPWVTIADQIDPGMSITDPTPALGAPEYRAISHTSLPSSNTGPTSVVPWEHGPHDSVYVNTGEGYGRVGRAFGSTASDRPTISQEAVMFEGFDYPIAIFGDGATHDTAFTGTIHDHWIKQGATTRAGWIDLLRDRQVVCYRDCQGRKIFGLLEVDFSQAGPVETVNIRVHQVWHEEGVTQ